jgi:hypothetical protein
LDTEAPAALFQPNLIATTKRKRQPMRNFRVASVTDLVIAWVGMRCQQLRRHQHESGRAKAALERTRLDEGFLHRVQRIAIGKALDGDELGTVGEQSEVETARNRRAVGSSPPFAFLTTW